MMVSSQVTHSDHSPQYEEMLNSGWMMGIYELQTKWLS